MLAPSATKKKGRNMHRKRVFAIALGAAALIVIATTSVALGDPTSSHSGGSNAVQTGAVRIDPHNPQLAYVSGRYSSRTGFAHLLAPLQQVSRGRPDSVL